MSFNIRITSGVLLIICYILSFLCFWGSSVFISIEKLIKSGLWTILTINAAAALIIILIQLMGFKPHKAVYLFSSFFCFPAVLAYSKLNWAERVLGLKLYHRFPSFAVAFLVILIMMGLITARYLLRYDKRLYRMTENGALEVEKVYRHQLAVFIGVMAGIALLMTFILITGTLLHGTEGMKLSPVYLILGGVGIVSVYTFYLLYSAFKGK